MEWLDHAARELRGWAAQPSLSAMPNWAWFTIGAVALVLIALAARIFSRRRSGGAQRAAASVVEDPSFATAHPSADERTATPPRPSLAASSDESDARMVGWRPLYPYISQHRFTVWKQEEVTARVPEEACPLAIKLFISHRWETPGDPDPHCKALPAIVQFLSRAYMAANGYLDEQSYLVQEIVAGDELREAFHERNLSRCTCGSVGWLELKPLLGADDVFYEKVTDTQRRRNFYRLLKHVRVWYDYAALPQARETSAERALLDRALDRLAGIVSESDVLALWGLESANRAWCMFEVLAGRKVYYCAPPAVQPDMMTRALLKAHGREDLAHYAGRPSQNIMIAVKGFKYQVRGLNEAEIEKYIRDDYLKCSVDEDYPRVAGLIHRYMSDAGDASEEADD